MPWSNQNVPSFVKNKSKEEQELAIKVANDTLTKTQDEGSAIFAAIAAVKEYNRKKTQQKALQSIRKYYPSHISSLLNKAIVEPVEAVAGDSDNKLPIRKEFLGENALPTGIQRNLVSAEFDNNSRLRLVFDTGEQIITKSVAQTVENYVNISGSSTRSKTVVVNTVADAPLIVTHDLNLSDPEAFVFTALLNGRAVDIQLDAMDSNSVEILTFVDTIGLKINFVGL